MERLFGLNSDRFFQEEITRGRQEIGDFELKIRT